MINIIVSHKKRIYICSNINFFREFLRDFLRAFESKSKLKDSSADRVCLEMNKPACP